jgi:hypothetical protein
MFAARMNSGTVVPEKYTWHHVRGDPEGKGPSNPVVTGDEATYSARLKTSI